MLCDGIKEKNKAIVVFSFDRLSSKVEGNFSVSWNLRQHVVVRLVGIVHHRFAELVMILARNDDSLYCGVLLHEVFPSQKLVVADFVQLELVAENENEHFGSFAPGPNHVISHARLITSEEFRFTLFQFFFKDVQSVVEVGDCARGTRNLFENEKNEYKKFKLSLE